MKRGASESDATSQATTTAPSSPPRTPKTPNNKRRPAYDGGGGDKSSSTTTTAHTTPVYRSPVESPSHASSTAHFSGTLIRSYSLATNRSAGAGAERKRHGGVSSHKQHQQQQKKKKEEEEEWKEMMNMAMDEEVYQLDDDDDLELPGWCVAVLCAVILVFVVVCLIVWAVARRYKPTVVVNSLTVHNFYAGEGTDLTGVPTQLVTLNCSLAMSVHNPSTMFGIHVSSRSIRLMYSEIAIATGQLDKFYQPKKSQHAAAAVLHGEKTPLYGAGATLVVGGGGGKGKKKQVALTLEMAVRTRGHVIGRLVRVTHDVQVRCPVAIETGSSRPVRFRRNDCSYKRP